MDPSQLSQYSSEDKMTADTQKPVVSSSDKLTRRENEFIQLSQFMRVQIPILQAESENE